jgi:16S rRNA (guanine527-N7)-methyltransferase
MTHPQAQELSDGLQALGLALEPDTVDRLLAYMDLIAKWNKVYNLTSVRLPADMLRQHLLDSLAVVPALRRYWQAQSGGDQPVSDRPLRLLDVGSGGGLPGVVIALCEPGWQVTCVDTVGKKTAFIQQVAATLRMPGLRAVNARVETLKGGDFDVVCSRAFASLADFTAWSGAALAPGGVWLAMKGKRPDAELLALPPEITLFHVEQLVVPGLDAERCLLWLRRG